MRRNKSWSDDEDVICVLMKTRCLMIGFLLKGLDSPGLVCDICIIQTAQQQPLYRLYKPCLVSKCLAKTHLKSLKRDITSRPSTLMSLFCFWVFFPVKKREALRELSLSPTASIWALIKACSTAAKLFLDNTSPPPVQEKCQARRGGLPRSETSPPPVMKNVACLLAYCCGI